MAEFLRSALSGLSTTDMPVIFTGNVHARKTKGLDAENAPPGMENSEPLGYLFAGISLLFQLNGLALVSSQNRDLSTRDFSVYRADSSAQAAQ